MHGGDTAKFRGHAEVCLVAAFIFQEKEYAVTLHELKAKQKVDEGPVIDKISWNIEAKDDFVTTMTRIQGNCLRILLDNFENVLQPKLNLGKEVTISDVPYFGYSNLGQLLERASNSVLEKKLVLGPYSHFFPRLAKEISNERYMRIR